MGLLLWLSSLVLLLLNFSLFHAHATSCREEERSALLQFKQSFVISKFASVSRNAYPKVLTWKPDEGESSNCCLWDGIHCDAEAGHIISLNLSSSCLFGSINSNSSLFQLVYLQNLSLADNHFNYSQIPSAFQQLSDLTYLNLSRSSFSGQIPHEISHLSKLSCLSISFNYEMRTGEKLLELRSPNLRNLVQNLTRLEVLSLAYVDISSQVPDFLANFSSLRWLILENCGLHGEFPAEIFQLPNLQVLNLQLNNNLTGVLPEFVKQSPLEWLLLYNTSFSGTIPSSIEKLGSLYLLSVHACNFSGLIPSSLGKLSQLYYLDLSDNQLSGYIPSSLQNLTKLTALCLEDNQYLTGPIPSWIGSLTQLSLLYLYGNQFNGTVEFDMFFDMKSLDSLALSFNNLSLHFEPRNKNASLSKFKCVALCGCNLNEFPYFLQYQRKLEWLALSQNKIHGQVPKWIWNTTAENLMMINLSYNFLTGFEDHLLPIFPQASLRFVDLSYNMLRGPLPIPPLSTMHYDVSNNKLSGEISPFICNLSSLLVLDLSTNKIHGAIPHCLGNFSDFLTVMNLGNNHFRGLISLAFTNASQLRMLDLSQNQLEGQLPQSLSSCKMLESLDLKDNQLADVFPTWLGTLPQLKHLILGKNNFFGLIGKPEKILDPFSRLRVIDLSCNHFVGELPSEYISNWIGMKDSISNSTYMKSFEIIDMEGKYLSFYRAYHFSFRIVNKHVETNYEKIQEAFAAIDLSSNNFSGGIPEIIGSLKGLHSLNLSNNKLTGCIPSSLGNLSELESLDLSQNKLSGEIPHELVQLTFLEFFNVSHNNLTGLIPQGNQLSAMDDSSFKGNPGLCGIPLLKKCGNPPEDFDPTVEEDDESGSLINLDWKFVLAGLISGLIIGVALGDMVIVERHGRLFKTSWRGQIRRRRERRQHRG